MVSLGEVALINPKPPTISETTEVAFVGMADLDATHAITDSGYVRKFSEVSKGYTIFNNGDVLVAKITPCFENNKIGQARLQRDVGVGSTEFHVLRPGERLDDRYLLHFLRQDRIRREGELRMTGSAGQRRVPVGFLRELKIPLPPLDDQRRIAAILDKAAGLVSSRGQIVALLETLSSAVFAEMFGEPVVNPMGWRLAPLDDICVAKGQYGANVPSVDYTPELPRYLRITDIGDNGSLLPNARSPGGNPTAWIDYGLDPGDLLFARSGATVGKTYLFRGTEGAAVYAGYLIRFRPNPEIVRPEYVHAFTRTQSYRSWVKAHANVVAQPNINAKQYGRELLVPVPPLDLQDEFVRQVDAIEHVRRLESASLVIAQSLVESIAGTAFAGRL
jgi:type I restriction enzyme S subunit